MLLPGLFRDCEKLIHRPLSPLSPPDSDVGVSGCIYSLIKYYRAELEKKKERGGRMELRFHPAIVRAMVVHFVQLVGDEEE